MTFTVYDNVLSQTFARHAHTYCYKNQKCNQQICPQSSGKRAALLGLLVTTRAKPARLARPTRLQFLEFTKQAATTQWRNGNFQW